MAQRPDLNPISISSIVSADSFLLFFFGQQSTGFQVSGPVPGKKGPTPSISYRLPIGDSMYIPGDDKMIRATHVCKQ